MVAEAGFLPEGAEVFLKRRTQEIAGTALILLGLFLAACILFYVSGDRSFNVATDRPIAHPLGAVGSHAADLLVRVLGAASLVLALVILVWGLRFLLHRPVSRLWLRLTTLPAATLAASVALTLFPAQIIWPELVDLRLGGIVGQMIVSGLTAWVPPWGGLAATSLISAGATALAVPLAAVAFGLSGGDWLSLARSGGKGIAVGGRAAWRAGGERPVEALADYLAEQTGHGALAVDDPKLAAEQFFGLLVGHIQVRALLGIEAEPPESARQAAVEEAVRTFLARYGA